MNTGADILEEVAAHVAGSSSPKPVVPESVTGESRITEERAESVLRGRIDEWLSDSERISARWDPEQFARQQIFSLVQTVFFPGWPRPARQVVFSSVDRTVDTSSACARISMAMADRLPGTVCVAEADRDRTSLDGLLMGSHRLEIVRAKSGLKEGQAVQSNLWYLPATEFYADQKPGPAWLRNRLSELRRAFDYMVIHAPAVSTCSDTALAGQMADGVILALDEQRTRRASAQKAREILISANARLLGVVLCEREFPIPERIYRRL